MNFVAIAESYCLIYWHDDDAFFEAAWFTPADFDNDKDDDNNNNNSDDDNDNDNDHYDKW